MIKVFRYAPIIGLSILLGAASSAHAAANEHKLYGISFFKNELIRIDPATGAGVQVAQLPNVSGYGLASYQGQLYTFDPNTQRIEQIDAASGEIVRSIDIGVEGLQGEGDLVIRNDGTGLLASALDKNANVVNDLYSFDLKSRTSTQLRSISEVVIDGMAVDSDGTVYVLGQGESNLYKLNSTNGLDKVGSLGLVLNSPFAALTFGPEGTLYASIDDRLYSISKESGVASVVNTNVLDFSFSSVAGLAYAPAILNSGDQLFGLTFFGNELISVNLTNGLGIGVSTIGDMTMPFGLANRFGKLYTFSAETDDILEIDAGTGATLSRVNVGLPNLQGEGDMAFRSDGVGFVASALDANGNPNGGLYMFDLLAKTSSRLGTTTVAIDALAFDENDVLYALGQGEGMLYTVNLQNGMMSPIGGLGVAQNSPFAALTFGPGGVLYAAIDDRLYSVDKSTGRAAFVDPSVLDLNFSSVAGLAFGSTPGRLSVTRSGNQLIFSWMGSGFTLETAESVTGPYTPATSQQNPQSVAITDQNRFFRLRK